MPLEEHERLLLMQALDKATEAHSSTLVILVACVSRQSPTVPIPQGSRLQSPARFPEADYSLVDSMVAAVPPADFQVSGVVLAAVYPAEGNLPVSASS